MQGSRLEFTSSVDPTNGVVSLCGNRGWDVARTPLASVRETASPKALRVRAVGEPFQGPALHDLCWILASPDLESISWHGTAIDVEAAEAIAATLEASECRLRYVSLASFAVGVRIGQAHCARIVGAAACKSSLDTLELQRVDIGSPGVAAVASALETCGRLRVLTVASCGLKPEHLLALQARLEAASALRCLDVSGNPGLLDTPESAVAMGRVLAVGRLTHLGLRNCGASSMAMNALSGGLAKAGKTALTALESLRVGENDMAAGVHGLASLVRLSPALRQLEAARCHISSSSFVTLCAALRCRRATLSTLTLSHNPLTDRSVSAARALLLSASTRGGALGVVDLFGCLVGLEGAAQLVMAALHCSKLRHLDLSGDIDLWRGQAGGFTSSAGVDVHVAGSRGGVFPAMRDSGTWDALRMTSPGSGSCVLPWLCRGGRQAVATAEECDRVNDGATMRAAGITSVVALVPTIGAIAGSASDAGAAPESAAASICRRYAQRGTVGEARPGAVLKGVDRAAAAMLAVRTADPIKMATPGCCRSALVRLARRVSRHRQLQARRRLMLVARHLDERGLPAAVISAIFEAAWGPGHAICDRADKVSILW